MPSSPAQDHAIIEAAVRAKRAQQQKGQAKAPPPRASLLNKAVTAGIWIAAAGSLAAVMMAG